MNKLVSINFGFENCEYGEVPVEHVSYFSLSLISKSINFYVNSTTPSEYEVIGKLYINFEKSFYGYQADTQIEGSSVINRIRKYQDICWFGMKYSDGTEKSYMVQWKDGSGDYENLGQKVEDTKYGMVLSINRKEDE